MWFTANLLFKSQRQANVNEGSLWEEQIILIEATNEAAAKQKAEHHGKAQENEYRNQAGELVHWSFEQVERLCEVEDVTLKDGSELFSRFLRDSEVRSILTPFED